MISGNWTLNCRNGYLTLSFGVLSNILPHIIFLLQHLQCWQLVTRFKLFLMGVLQSYRESTSPCKFLCASWWHTEVLSTWNHIEFGPQGLLFQPLSSPFDIKTRTCSLWGKAQLLPFNERCSSSPCQQQCVTTTGWRHLVSLRGASAVKQNLQSCHFTLTDEPTWTGQEHGGHIMGPPVVFSLKEGFWMPFVSYLSP